MASKVTRRSFLRTVAAVAGGAAATGRIAGAADLPAGGVPTRPFGTTGVHVSALGLGGYHIGSARDEDTAVRLVHEAIDAGVTFLDKPENTTAAAVRSGSAPPSPTAATACS